MRWMAILGCLWLLAGTVGAQTPELPPEVKEAFKDGFKNARDEPPPLWTGREFKLRKDYPKAKPAAEEWPWLKFDFKNPKEAAQYLLAVRDYCYQDNLDVDWQQHHEKKQGRIWYHAPWMHADMDKGREFVNGLTRELTSPGHQLHRVLQQCLERNWAVSLYNPMGGHTLGQVWSDINKPNPKAARFEVGTVSVKLLFTTATKETVPYLDGALEWDAHVKDRGPLPFWPLHISLSDPPRPHQITKLRLLQLDVAVRDERANDTTGWVFGTFIYHKNAPGATPWDKMVPVGLMWGNDPEATSDKHPIKESWNNEANPLIKQAHDLGRWGGWNGRLNGPVDNPRSACLSCHSTAQASQKVDMTWEKTPEKVMDWFRNLKPGVAFTDKGESLDYSLQLAKGIQNCDLVLGKKLTYKKAKREWYLETDAKEKIFPVRRGTDDSVPDVFRNAPSPAAPKRAPQAGEPPPMGLSWWRSLGGLALVAGLGAGGLWWFRQSGPRC